MQSLWIASMWTFTRRSRSVIACTARNQWDCILHDCIYLLLFCLIWMIRMVVKLWALGIYQILHIVLLNRSTNLNVLKWYQIEKNYVNIIYVKENGNWKIHTPHSPWWKRFKSHCRCNYTKKISWPVESLMWKSAAIYNCMI